MPEYLDVSIDRCVIDPEFNTRTKGLGDLTDLVESIKAIGIQLPLLGKDKQNSAEEIEIYVGFRRLEAAKQAGLSKVPVKVTPRRSVTKKQMLIANVAENAIREDLNPVDEALAMARMQEEHSMSVDDICGNLGVKRSKVTSRFKLLKLNELVREAIHDGRISVAAALEIDRLPKSKQGRFVVIAEELGGQRLKSMIDKELEKLQDRIVETEKVTSIEVIETETTTPKVETTEYIKTIRKSNKMIANGLGYTDDEKAELKEVDFRALDPNHMRTVATFLEDIAEQVPDDIEVNDKAERELVEAVESEILALDYSSPVVRQSLVSALMQRAKELAVEGTEPGKRIRVTYKIAQDAVEEFFTEVTE